MTRSRVTSSASSARSPRNRSASSAGTSGSCLIASYPSSCGAMHSRRGRAAPRRAGRGGRSPPTSYPTSVTQLVNAVRLVGSVTRIESLIPPGAKALPVQEVIPVAEVWLPTGNYRRRTNLSLSAPVTLFVEVPYSLPDESQQEQADAAALAMRNLYKTFIRAVHDQYGRPWHDGWAWAGPGPEDADSSEPNATVNLVPERVLALRDYVHWLNLSDGPRAIVMKHRTKASYVRVTYDRVNAIQKVARFSMPGDIDPATVFDFEWGRMPGWGPRSEGVGAVGE